MHCAVHKVQAYSPKRARHHGYILSDRWPQILSSKDAWQGLNDKQSFFRFNKISVSWTRQWTTTQSASKKASQMVVQGGTEFALPPQQSWADWLHRPSFKQSVSSAIPHILQTWAEGLTQPWTPSHILHKGWKRKCTKRSQLWDSWMCNRFSQC